jgi:16S rRNA (uracil1498-N3)-methyltransferase
MPPRFHCLASLTSGQTLALPAGAARHVQVLRMQPGEVITLFNGEGGEFAATIVRMGRSDVEVEIGAHDAAEREAPRAVHLAVGIPANERMDWLVEKATELGVASIQPLFAARSVLRLKGERADKKAAHWQAIAVAACEQCGRNRVPVVHAALGLEDWLAASPPPPGSGFVLSLRASEQPLRAALPSAGPVTFLSGPEGGLTENEESMAVARGFTPLRLGTRVLRAETAPLAVLSVLAFGA